MGYISYNIRSSTSVSRLPSSISWIKVIVTHCRFPQEGQERSSGRDQPIPTDGSRGRLQRRAIVTMVAWPQDSVPTVIQYGDGLTFYLSHV
ncbi:2-iminobutanoate/2-iminopropanoate deaminase [Fusarium oxysporum f. sp. albedinis]|nr:2-iminobutanoate/2-iminopropanoate deaminase [Fusarium oxysporum f. sp. albedinis]